MAPVTLTLRSTANAEAAARQRARRLERANILDDCENSKRDGRECVKERGVVRLMTFRVNIALSNPATAWRVLYTVLQPWYELGDS